MCDASEPARRCDVSARLQLSRRSFEFISACAAQPEVWNAFEASSVGRVLERSSRGDKAKHFQWAAPLCCRHPPHIHMSFYICMCIHICMCIYIHICMCIYVYLITNRMLSMNRSESFTTTFCPEFPGPPSRLRWATPSCSSPDFRAACSAAATTYAPRRTHPPRGDQRQARQQQRCQR